MPVKPTVFKQSYLSCVYAADLNFHHDNSKDDAAHNQVEHMQPGHEEVKAEEKDVPVLQADHHVRAGV